MEGWWMIVAHITILIIIIIIMFIFVETKFTIQTKQPNKVLLNLGEGNSWDQLVPTKDFTNLKLVVPLFWYMISPNPKLASCIMWLSFKQNDDIVFKKCLCQGSLKWIESCIHSTRWFGELTKTLPEILVSLQGVKHNWHVRQQLKQWHTWISQFFFLQMIRINRGGLNSTLLI